MRLIDAEKLSESVMKVWDFAEENGQKKLANAIADVLVPAIVSQPTVEAEPVRHGHWKITDRDVMGCNEYTCSVCGHDTEGWKATHYCENCGAKMDEVEE